MSVKLVVKAAASWIPILSAACALIVKVIDVVDETKVLKEGVK